MLLVKTSNPLPLLVTFAALRNTNDGGMNHFELNEMEADHIKPWREGGKTMEENCQLLCKDDNRRKSGK